MTIDPDALLFAWAILPKQPPLDSLAEAVSRYTEKFGVVPTYAFVNPAMIDIFAANTAVEIGTASFVPVNTLYLGNADGPSSAGSPTSELT